MKDKTEGSKIYKLLFEAATEGLIVSNTSGNILLANNRAGEIFGYTVDELKHLNVDDLLPQHRRPSHKTHREAYTDNPHKRPMGKGYDLIGLRKDGSSVPVEISLNHFREGGELRVMALIMDVGQRKEQEAQIMKLSKEKELNELKSRFVSMASHEFRTPLSTVLGSLSLIQKYDEQGEHAKKEKHYQRIKGAVRQLTSILNDFLSLEKVESGKVSVNLSTFDARTTASEIVGQMQDAAKEGQRIHFAYEGADTAHTDQNILRIILTNLLGNAIKYSGEGKNIWLTMKNSGTQLHITVKDEGIGIPYEDQPNMFDRFFRAKNALNIEGTGLGLNIVYRYLQMLGGSIRFESTPMEGSVFFVELQTATHG